MQNECPLNEKLERYALLTPQRQDKNNAHLHQLVDSVLA
jgi:hypothetical protein